VSSSTDLTPKTVAGSWLANSDRRIKTDIQNLTSALDIMGRLRPVRFHYTADYKAKHSSIQDIFYYNFIAQEFQEVFPDSVKDSGEDGILQVDTYNVIPYAVAAIQELKKKNDELENRIQILEKALKAR
jgi:hypothetical protein